MAIYDTEEEQVEQLKKWWETNQSSVISGVIGAIVLVAAINFWQQHQQQNRAQASTLYQNILADVEKKQWDDVIKIAGQLNSDFASSAYAHFAALYLAKANVEKGDLEAAKAVLEKEIKLPESPEFQHIARLRLIQLLLATKQYEAGLKIISEIDPASMTGFEVDYDELQGDLYLAMDRQDEARTAYQSAVRTGQASPLVQFKLNDLAVQAFPESQPK